MLTPSRQTEHPCSNQSILHSIHKAFKAFCATHQPQGRFGKTHKRRSGPSFYCSRPFTTLQHPRADFSAEFELSGGKPTSISLCTTSLSSLTLLHLAVSTTLSYRCNLFLKEERKGEKPRPLSTPGQCPLSSHHCLLNISHFKLLPNPRSPVEDVCLFHAQHPYCNGVLSPKELL
jgi:hypothetical protein